MYPKRIKNNGVFTKKVNLKEGPDNVPWDANVFYGYGTPTTGEYYLAAGGWKTFGTFGQGGIKQGADNNQDIQC